MKEVNKIWKKYQNVRTTPSILENRTFTLLDSKTPNSLVWSSTSQYHSNSHILVCGTGKHKISLKEINRIWKEQNIRKTLAILGYPFYHIKRFWKITRAVRHTDNNKKKLVWITEKQLKTVKIVKEILRKLRNCSCCLLFSV